MDQHMWHEVALTKLMSLTMLHLPHACTHARAHSKTKEQCINIATVQVQSKLAKQLAKTCSSLMEGLVQRHASVISSMVGVCPQPAQQ